MVTKKATKKTSKEGRDKKGRFGEGNSGRPKGTKNKYTTMKAAFTDAFEEIGGADALAEWAKKDKNKGTFYKILTKLLPSENTTTLEGNLTLEEAIGKSMRQDQEEDKGG